MASVAAVDACELKTQNADTPPVKAGCSPRLEVLANQDILELIFSYFDPGAFFEDIWTLDQAARSNLLSACLTCKDFYAPALGLLWRMMTSIVPIFKLIPAFKKVNDSYTLTGVISAEHIARLEMHARKIRFLHLKSTLQENIPGHILFRFANLRNFSLFPALKQLYIPFLTLDLFRNIEGLNFLFLAQGPSLESITLGGVNTSTEAFMSSFLSTLSQKCELTQKLTLTGRLTLEILSFVPEFRHLRTLNLTFDAAIQLDFLRLCSQPTSLAHLLIHLHPSSTIDGSTTVNKKSVGGFGALQELRISASPSDTSKILEVIDKAVSLNIIILSCPLNWNHDQSTTALATRTCIAECCRISPSLTKLTVQMGKNKSVLLPRGSLSPLLQCKNLRSLVITGVSLAMRDDDINQLCEEGNWRDLRVLWLPSSVEGDSPSLSSLHTLAGYCPRLRILGFPVDFKLDFSSLDRERLHPRQPHKLERLTIVKSASGAPSVQAAIAVSRFLEFQFPFLDEAELTGDGDSGWWKIVQALIEEYKLVRAEEQRRHAEFASSEGNISRTRSVT